MAASTFVREVECAGSVLNIHQYSIGDVGCVVWDAALVLVKFLENLSFFPSNFWKGKRVIELGSGTGVVGLCSCVHGADVTITDLPACLPLMKRNIQENAQKFIGKIDVSVLEWGQDVASFLPPPDIILMSDLLYYDDVLEKLVNTINCLSSCDTLIVMSYEVRTVGTKSQTIASFFEMMSNWFSSYCVEYDSFHECCRSRDIQVYFFKKEIH